MLFRSIIGEGSATNPAAPGVTLTVPGGTKSNFAWQAGAGISLELTKQLAIDIGYRYFDAGRIETDAGNAIVGGVVVGPYSGAKGDLAAHEFVGSVRFGF